MSVWTACAQSLIPKMAGEDIKTGAARCTDLRMPRQQIVHGFGQKGAGRMQTYRARRERRKIADLLGDGAFSQRVLNAAAELRIRLQSFCYRT
ncbi:hypothetical protein CF68_12775 [Cupriavidus sp. SK-4]|nr:hypothetical protein CF68_12775 [Cupriavidus sp. SK-4]